MIYSSEIVLSILVIKFNLYCFLGLFRYASRVKLITNDASKNADNKEIARLKGVSLLDSLCSCIVVGTMRRVFRIVMNESNFRSVRW